MFLGMEKGNMGSEEDLKDYRTIKGLVKMMVRWVNRKVNEEKSIYIAEKFKRIKGSTGEEYTR